MNNVLVIGGSGVLGSAVVNLLQQSHISFLIGSRDRVKLDAYSTINRSLDLPWIHTDLLTGEGLVEALVGIDTVFHLASGQGKIGPEAYDVVITRNLLKAVEKSAVKQVIYSSIVGVDKIPLSYHRAKVEAENLIEQSRISSKILRATQFHDLVDSWIGKLLRLPVGFVPPKLLLQPIPVSTVAHELCELAQSRGKQMRVQIGGAQVYPLGALSRLWMQYKQTSKFIVPLPIVGGVMKAVAQGALTCPTRAVNSQTWENYLKERYGYQH